MADSPNRFFDEFNPKLDAAERMMGETITFNGADFAVIAIDDLTIESINTPGGQIAGARLVVHVRKDIYTEMEIKRGQTLTARNQKVRLLTTSDEGDDSISLICGSVTAPL